jgi:hypothetical protein
MKKITAAPRILPIISILLNYFRFGRRRNEGFPFFCTAKPGFWFCLLPAATNGWSNKCYHTGFLPFFQTVQALVADSVMQFESSSVESERTKHFSTAKKQQGISARMFLPAPPRAG